MKGLKDIKAVYFLGAGGIGMSALVRYFLKQGMFVAGYDRTPSELTSRLIEEGAVLHFEENTELIPEICRNPSETLVIYTPAIPADHKEWAMFRDNGFTIKKRAEVLGLITKDKLGICAAGTHGKTTTSTMTAHLLKQSHVDCNAFLGGISKNYKSNLILADDSDLVVIEADEYDYHIKKNISAFCPFNHCRHKEYCTAYQKHSGIDYRADYCRNNNRID